MFAITCRFLTALIIFLHLMFHTFQVFALLPITLDTPMNRKWMPKADTSTWTSLEFVADLLFKWSSAGDQRPKNGSLVQLVTKEGTTDLVIE